MSSDILDGSHEPYHSPHAGKLMMSGHLTPRGLPLVPNGDFSSLLEKLGTRSCERKVQGPIALAPYSKDSNYLKFSTTDSDKMPNVKTKRSMESDIMRRVLDNIHCPADDIGSRTSCGSTSGVPWRRSPRRRRSASGMDLMGPGRYDTSSCYEEKLASVKYIEANKIIQGMKWERKMKDQKKYYDSPRKSAVISPEESARERGPVEATNRKIQIKFSGSARFVAPEYRSEKYVKTTGMQLTLDYDRKFNKRIPISVTGYSERECYSTKLLKPPFEYNTSITLDVDSGSQASLNTDMIKSPLKFSKAFKSKIEAGYTYPTPTSGNVIGPGSFPGADTPAVAVKNPDRKSPAFLVPRPYERTKMATLDSLAKVPTFTEINDRGTHFSLSDASGKKNNHLAEWTKKKIVQIYPRLRTYKE